MNNSTKTALAVVIMASAGAGGAAVLASPWLDNTQQAQAVDRERVLEDEVQESEDDEELDEQQEAARLRPLAKITPEQAQQSAQQFQSGEVKELELEGENGNLVYEVTIGETEIFVDAGNGEVLYTQGVNEKVDPATEAARPRSSIQVPDLESEEGEAPLSQ